MPERAVKVLSRRLSDGQISMWGTLHLNVQGGTIAGWLCDSWTESNPDELPLKPRLHWLSKEDDRFHRVQIDIPVAGFSSINIGPVDEDIEARREAFLRTTLAQWENEYFTTQGVNIAST
jgi:hypothetical protein